MQKKKCIKESYRTLQTTSKVHDQFCIMHACKVSHKTIPRLSSNPYRLPFWKWEPSLRLTTWLSTWRTRHVAFDRRLHLPVSQSPLQKEEQDLCTAHLQRNHTVISQPASPPNYMNHLVVLSHKAGYLNNYTYISHCLRITIWFRHKSSVATY